MVLKRFLARFSVVLAVIGWGAFSDVHAHDSASESHRIRSAMVVIPIDAVELPAPRSGIIAAIRAEIGESVSAGDLVALLDDRHARLTVQLAENELAIASRAAGDTAEVSSAKSRLDGQRQLAERLAILRQIADLQAKNPLQVLAAEKSQAAAENQYRRAMDSRSQFAESVSQSEIDALKLSVEQSRLESQQARFQSDIASLNAKAESESLRVQQQKIQQARADWESASNQAAITTLTLQSKKTEVEIAKAEWDDHRVVAPHPGQVTRIYKHVGSWANVGEPIARIVRLDRLRVEGFAPTEILDSVPIHGAVTLRVHTAGPNAAGPNAAGPNTAGPNAAGPSAGGPKDGDQTIELDGEIVFVDPEIDPVNGDFRFWIDFDNPKIQVLPGMHADVILAP